MQSEGILLDWEQVSVGKLEEGSHPDSAVDEDLVHHVQGSADRLSGKGQSVLQNFGPLCLQVLNHSCLVDLVGVKDHEDCVDEQEKNKE